MASLQKLTEHCQFGEGWEDALRDRLVCGIRDEAVRKCLLSMGHIQYPYHTLSNILTWYMAMPTDHNNTCCSVYYDLAPFHNATVMERILVGCIHVSFSPNRSFLEQSLIK